MIGLPKHSPLTINVTPATLTADLRERARLAQLLARSRGQRIDALYMQAAANEIDRLNKLLAERPLITLPDDIGEPEDNWPRCDHGTPIPPGDSPIEHCMDCQADAYLGG